MAAAAAKPAVPDLPAAPAIPKYMTAAERAESEKNGLPPPPELGDADNEYAKKFGLDDDDDDDVSNDVNVTSQQNQTNPNAPTDGKSQPNPVSMTLSTKKGVLYDRLKDQQKMFLNTPEEPMTSSMTSSITSPNAKEVKKAASPTPASAALAAKARQNQMNAMSKGQSDRIRLLKRRIQRLELVNKSLAVWPTKLPQQGKNANASLSAAAEARRQQKEAAAEEYKRMKVAAEKKEEETAVLMIKHLLGWFDSRIPAVTLPEWNMHVDIHKKYAGGSSVGGGINTPGGTFTVWCSGLVELYLDTRDMDVQYIIKDCRKKVASFASSAKNFEVAVDSQVKELDDKYPLIKEEIRYLKKRVVEINQACNGIGGTGRGSDTSPFQKTLSTTTGSTYWVFNSLNKFSLEEMINETKSFVESLLSLGTKLDSEVETAKKCIHLANTIDGIAFFQKDPTVCKEIAECLNAIQATTRTLVMGVFQGGDTNTEYNVIIGTNLGKIKNIVSTTVPSRRKNSLHSRLEGEIAEKAVKYLISTIKFYKPFANQPTIRDLLKDLNLIPKLLVEFLRQYTIIRDTSILEWSTFLKSGFELAKELEKFRATFLSPEFDPDGMFKECSGCCEQCIHQLLIAIMAVVYGNTNCPRHEIAMTVRAICFTLVAIMDLCYLSSY